MKVLIVCSGNAVNFNFSIHQAFVYEQIEKIKQRYNIEYDSFFIKGKGILGYLRNIPDFRRKIKTFDPDIIHSHYSLSGFISLFQNKKPVVITYHGGDIISYKNRIISKITCAFADHNIFVSDTLKNIVKCKRKYDIVPCGVDTEKFFQIDLKQARKLLGFDLEKIYILFASSFENKVKNYTLALDVMKKLKYNVELIELKNKTREEVNLLLNACNLLLLTSFSEGSPQIIKEAMACGCPIVATNVGDIKNIIQDIEGCYITSFDVADVIQKVEKAIKYSLCKVKTNGREKIIDYDNNLIAEKIFQIYVKVLKYENHYN